ncbi:hypothetical protein [Xenorhabdus sp. KK7.4]|uniref:hypothetical protein n=1 Tax=Xenorhabdus sp. KK7.4 TaxID=1851572 RepID=UPI000C03BD27|nr:hypothetical protein [Xenorhabdus sp. KK7.4]PHM57021.1 hypothetical protein Xekk_01590 [Xenorhabdus sp. KK7.4]
MSKAIREEGNVAYVIGWIDLDQNPHSEYDKGNSNVESRNKEEHMSTGLSKTELEALLRANKAEVDVVAATMKQEMTEWKGQQTTLFANLNISLAKIDGKLDAVEGKIDGLKTSLTTTQWATSIGLTLVTIIMSAVMLTSSWIISGKNTSSSPQPTTQSQQVEPAKK